MALFDTSCADEPETPETGGKTAHLAAEMPLSETCIIAEITEEAYNASKEAQDRYRLGQLKTKMEIRQSVVKLAKAGDPRMVKVYLDLNAARPTLLMAGGGDEFDNI